MTTAELWNALEAVLREKGATDAWIEYALPDLQIAANQFAFDQFGRGHRAACRGESLPNMGPDDRLMVIATEIDGSRWLSLDGPTMEMIKAPLPSGMLDTPEARDRLQAALAPSISSPAPLCPYCEDKFPDECRYC